MRCRWERIGWMMAATLTACAQSPDPATAPAETPRPASTPAPASAPAATTGTSPRAAPVEYDEVTETRRGEIAYSSEAHQLRVDTGVIATTYRTSPMSRSENGGGEAAEAALAAALRYPGRISSTTGAFVQELTEQGNELIAVTYQTTDTVPAAAEVYRSRFQQASMETYMVTIPLDDSELVQFFAGMGARRYRVQVAPGDGGARVEVTQMFIRGAATQEFLAGQGVLQPVAATAAPPA